MEVNSSFWIGFNLFVLLMLALDLGVFNRKAHVVSVKEALTWSGIWISLALLFNSLISRFHRPTNIKSCFGE
jgi:tellurite resistance protein TerC